MSDLPPVLQNKPKPRLWVVLFAVGIGVFIIFALSVASLTWLLLHKRGAPTINTFAEPNNTPADVGFAQIFNGQDLDGWAFDPTVWSVRNGVVYGQQRRGGYGSCLFWRDADIADFELRFRFRLVRGNSGVYYRASRLANFDVGGYEFEIYTNRTGNLADNGTDRVKRRLHREEAAQPIDSEWHEGVIVASGPRLVHWLDGKIYCDVEDTGPTAPKAGAIALGITSSTVVEFKDIRLKRTRANR